MRLAYLETFAGISGDMLLGAFIQAGVPVRLLEETLAALKLGAALEITEVERSGIHAVKVNVRVGEHLAEAIPAHEHEHANGSHRQDHANGGSHRHDHDHEHHHRQEHETRSLREIRKLIGGADLPEAVKSRAARAFELLGEAEALIHHRPLAEIHFHEAGAVDSVADMVLACAAAEFLRIDAWHGSPLNVGGGTVECAHGRFPVPAPATAELLRGAPTYSSGIQMELVTPTGAALVRALDVRFGPAPAMRVSAIGYGAGTRDPAGFANVLRLSVGEGESAEARTDTVLVLEAAIDDLNPQIIGYVTERALALGALDAMCAPVQMKKNRPGTLITILCDQAHLEAMEKLLLTETSTLGVRVREERRICLERRSVKVATPWGMVAVKVGRRDEVELKAAPEFEDCRTIAEAHSLPLKLVMETALRAYREKGGLSQP
jgi:uncharacterized protein (TIGR00299 family) protein